MIRILDIFLSLLGLILCGPLMFVIYLMCRQQSGGAIFLQVRVGRYQKPFTLVKFRTMLPGTASVASHLVDGSNITPLGGYLRRTKLDELPQLWNVLKGEMSLVGPRPCLFNQVELISERSSRGVFDARPGITGLAQVNKIDMATPKLLAEMDMRMLNELSLNTYIMFIMKTLCGKGAGDVIKFK